jgi:quercetin dioxygenase-like cupin family protein
MQIVNTHPIHVRPVAHQPGGLDPTTDVVTLAPGGAIARREQSPAGIALVLHGALLVERDSDVELVTAGMVIGLPGDTRQWLRNAGDSAARFVVYTPVRTGLARPPARAVAPASAAAD